MLVNLAQPSIPLPTLPCLRSAFAKGALYWLCVQSFNLKNLKQPRPQRVTEDVPKSQIKLGEICMSFAYTASFIQ